MMIKPVFIKKPLDVMVDAIKKASIENSSQPSEKLLLRHKLIGKFKQTITKRPRSKGKRPIPIGSGEKNVKPV